MSKTPAFQFYAQDFLTGVMYLTNEEIGIYIKMLAKQWTDGKIPKKRLGFLVGIGWEKFSDELKEKFEDRGEYLVNKRLEEERDRKENFLNKQRTNGKKGGRPSKNQETEKPKLNPNESQKKPLEDEYEEEIENEKRKINLKENFRDSNFDLELEKLKKEIENQFSWKESLIKNYSESVPGFDAEALNNHLETFFKLLEGDGEETKNLKDFKKHFNRWLKIQIEKSLKNQGNDRSSKTNAELYNKAINSEAAKHFKFS